MRARRNTTNTEARPRRARQYIGHQESPYYNKKNLSKPQIQQIILRNKKQFVLGKEIAEKKLRKWYTIPELALDGLSAIDTVTMVRSHDLCMVAAYIAFNRVLTRRGLVIRRIKGKYMIQSLPRAEVRVKQLRHESVLKKVSAKRLNTGIRRYQGIFSALSEEELRS